MLADIIEISKPVGLYEVGHYTLRSAGYCYSEMKEQSWCIVWCALHPIHLPPMLLPHEQS